MVADVSGWADPHPQRRVWVLRHAVPKAHLPVGLPPPGPQANWCFDLQFSAATGVQSCTDRTQPTRQPS